MKSKASRSWWRGQKSQRKRRKSSDSSLVSEQGAIELSPEVAKSQPSRSIRWPFAPVFNSPWFWPFFISGATALGAAIWIFNLPPLPECRNLSLGATDAERLYCADMAARRGNINALMAALELVSQWPSDHPLYAQAQRLSNEWSQATIVIARRQFEQGNIDYAKTIIQKVPKTSTHYTQAQTLITLWTTDEGSSLAAQASSAINAADWPAALDIARRLTLLNSDHWNQVASELLVRINQERQAWGQLEEARSLAGWQTAKELVEAILITQKIDPQTIAGERVPDEIQPWIAEVIAYAEEWQATGNIQDAISLISDIAPVLRTRQGTPALLQLGQAEAAANQDTFWGYWEALARLESLPPEPALTAYVTTKQQAWEAQVQNLGQLQLSRWLAKVDQTWGYELAILQAQNVPLGQPRRIEAQTLIAQWQNQVQASQVQPLLTAAQQLAASENYLEAQRIAQRIPTTNPLYGTAQAETTQWQAQLDTQRDQPILTQAKALAEHQKLSEAIRAAGQIPADSPLYRQARDQIRAWKQEKQQIEDAQRPRWSRPIPEPEVPPTQTDSTADNSSAEPIDPYPSPAFVTPSPASPTPTDVPLPNPSPTESPASPEPTNTTPPPNTPSPTPVTPAPPSEPPTPAPPPEPAPVSPTPSTPEN